MSKSRRKKQKSSSSTQDEKEFLSDRVVAIPKPEEPEIALSPPEEELALIFKEIAQEPEPEPLAVSRPVPQEREIRVVVSEPKPEPRVEPKTAKPNSAAERIGDRLREARLAREDDLYLIAEFLCIKPAFLIALENSRYDEFPADAYVIGFLRTYANFLGIDGKMAVDRYRYEMAGRRKKPVLMMPTPVSEGRTPSGIVMVGAAIALVLIYALWYNISSANRAEVHVAPPLPTSVQSVSNATSASNSTGGAGLTEPVSPSAAVTPAETAPAQQTPPVAGTAAQNAAPASTEVVIPPASPGIVVTAEKPPAVSPKGNEPENNAKANKEEGNKEVKAEAEDKKLPVFGDSTGTSRVVIRATENSWVMVVDDTGKTVFDRTLKPGESYKVPNAAGLSLTTGNGNGIVLSLDGKDLPKVATGAPHVVRNIPLDPGRLSQPDAATH